MEVKPGSSIYLFDNVISEDFMKDLKIIIDNTDGRKEVYGPGSNVQGKIVLMDDFKNQEFAKVIDNKVEKIMGEIFFKLRSIIPHISIRSDSEYQYRRIEGATRLHIDDILGSDEFWKMPMISTEGFRALSVIIALNDDYEGGELCFPQQNIEIKLKKGQAIAFPPYWTHPHNTNELMNGTVRYTVNTWLHN